MAAEPEADADRADVTPEEHGAMLQDLLDAMPDGAAGWREHADLVNFWTTWLDRELGRCTDIGFAMEFAAGHGRDDIAEFLSKLIEVGETRVLAAPRFVGGDTSQPFADLYAWTGPRSIGSTAAAAIDAFGSIGATKARILLPGSQPPELPEGWSVAVDQHVVAAPIREMLATPTPAGFDVVRLEPAAVESADSFMREAYAAFHAREPELAPRVQPSDREELERCRSAGHLWWWRTEGARAGLLALRPEPGFGIDGLLVQEEIVAPEFVGRGTAACAQLQVAAYVAGRPNADPDRTVIHGTIDGANGASLATAARAGRRTVSTLWFLEPPSTS